jgi:poly-gamma-glutamate synthesis protein (capsule biosynthesis protein)
MEKVATLKIVGDIMLGGSVINKISQFGPTYPFDKLSTDINHADIFFGNLECSIVGDNKIPLTKKILLLSDTLVINGLKGSGINIVSLANNHTFDYGIEAFINSRVALEENGIKCVGGGKNIKEASRLTLFEVNQLHFGFLAYGSKEAACFQFANDSSYGVAPIDPLKIQQDIKAAKHQTDFVIVSLHWGKEFRDYPSPENIKIARSLIDNGAILVVGSHSHVFQGYEQYNSGLILYDLGSFIFGDILMDTPIKYKYYLKKKKAKEGIMVDCVFNKKGLVDYKFTPILINADFQATIPNCIVQKKVLQRFEKQSKRIISKNYNFFYSKVYLIKVKIKFRIKKILHSIKIILKLSYSFITCR